MFGIFGKKKVNISSPVEGAVKDITEVADKVFSTKMMGDGFAVEPTAGYIVAPCDGKVVVLPETNHAVAIVSDGLELLIHIGIDTVQLAGKGFNALVTEGAMVKKGDKLIEFDIEYIKSQDKALTTMLVITNMDEKVKSISKNLSAGCETIMTVELK